jgi:hypothetical protein
MVVAGRPGDGADKDSQPRVGNGLHQHYQRALKVRMEAVQTAGGFIKLPPGK